MMEHLVQILMLLGVAVAVVVTFQRLRIPTSLGYLLVGLILGPHTIGPTIYVPEFKALAEFGVVLGVSRSWGRASLAVRQGVVDCLETRPRRGRALVTLKRYPMGL